MAFEKLFYDRSWTFYWDSKTGRMYGKEASMFLGRDYHFHERTWNRSAAIALARAWLHG
ncbi:MAG TPA: hypothetical protein VGC35_05040 [Allosphingosinicella sp.]|jgi:hypothetical protein